MPDKRAEGKYPNQSALNVEKKYICKENLVNDFCPRQILIILSEKTITPILLKNPFIFNSDRLDDQPHGRRWPIPSGRPDGDPCGYVVDLPLLRPTLWPTRRQTPWPTWPNPTTISIAHVQWLTWLTCWPHSWPMADQRPTLWLTVEFSKEVMTGEYHNPKFHHIQKRKLTSWVWLFNNLFCIGYWSVR